MAASKVIIEGIPGANGEYEIGELTNRDLHQIKQISGVRLGEFEDAANAGDNDLVVAFAAVALRQNGKQVPLDALWDAPAGAKITLALGEEEPEAEADAGPPSQRPTEPEEPLTPSVSRSSSGSNSSDASASPARIRPVTGLPLSGTGSASDQVTSAI